MKSDEFSDLLLETAFSCMACDGHIDDSEIELIRNLEEKEKLFEVEDIGKELNELIAEMNKDSHTFLKQYLNKVQQSDLSEDEEIRLVDTALKTIEADEHIAYSEIKFFKIILSRLNLTRKELVNQFPDFEEYMEQDILTDDFSDTGISNYLKNKEMPKLDTIDIPNN